MISWIGGKFHIKDWIISHFPPHKYFVEVFGGAGWISWTKEPVKLNVYNDKNAMLTNLFYHFFFNKKEFLEKAKNLPISDRLIEFFSEKISKPNKLKNLKVEDAIMFVYCVTNSFDGCYKGRKYIGFSPKVIMKTGRDYRAFLKRLESINYKGNLVLHNRDYKWIIEKYDNKDTLFYIDPPYLDLQWYEIKFNLKDHEELAKILNRVRSKVCVSYYPKNILYKWYPKRKWFYDYKEVPLYSEKANTKQKKTEMLIMNYDYTKVRTICGKQIKSLF